MAAWLIWLIGAGLLAVAEVFTLDLVLLMFGGAALAGAASAAIGLPLWIQVLTFTVASVALLMFVRPVARRHLESRTPEQVDGPQALVGRTALVTQPVDEHGGRIKIGGDEWTAVSMTPYQSYEVGDVVRVMEIRGASAVVTADVR